MKPLTGSSDFLIGCNYWSSESAISMWHNWWMKDTKHLYRTFQFKTEKDWKEYTLKYKVPEDSETYPALLRNLMTHFRIGAQALAKGASAKVYLDDISYTILK